MIAIIKMYESIIKKKKKKYDKIELLARTRLNSVDHLISKSLLTHKLVTMN